MVPFYSYTSTYLLSHIQPPPIIIFPLHLIDICTARRYNGTRFCFFLQGVAVVIFPRRADRKEIQGLEVYDALGYTRTKDGRYSSRLVGLYVVDGAEALSKDLESRFFLY